MQNYIQRQIQESIAVKQRLLEDNQAIETIKKVSSKIVQCYKNNNKTLLAGNGGSAADAQHIAGEFVSRFYFDRPGLASIALTTDTSILTAIGNDYSYKRVFARQIQANAVSGDVFIAISTSGNSENIIEALNECKNKQVVTVGLTGKSGGKMADLCDYCIKAPSDETPRIQEAHILIAHIICAIVEEEIFGKTFKI